MQTLAKQSARKQANNQPPDQPAKQSTSQPATLMPFKHLLLPAMCLSLSLSLSLCLSNILQRVVWWAYKLAASPRGGRSEQACSQPAERSGQFPSKQRGILSQADNDHLACQPAGHTAKLVAGQSARGRPARRPSSQLACLPANHPPRSHRGNSHL